MNKIKKMANLRAEMAATPNPKTSGIPERDTSIQPYWFQDLNVLLNMDLAGEIFPKREMPYSAKINAMVRFSWYLGILGMIVNMNYLFLYIPFVTMLITYLLYLFREKENRAEAARMAAVSPQKSLGEKDGFIDSTLADKFEEYLNKEGKCTDPSVTNPFMNPLPFDNRHRSPACNIYANQAKQIAVELAYDQGRYRDNNDVWNSDGGRRQFYTVASTTYPSDQGSFANWLYKRGPTCKEGNGDQCIANVHDQNLYHRLGGSFVGV